jgi:hypothetical protein
MFVLSVAVTIAAIIILCAWVCDRAWMEMYQDELEG